ncbi:MAG: 4-(cytidine 5'-diphospho)-2-C-methyl-D-erythritol kinase [Candidatus Euphemobacter frigidus]|nr:4-(cytidine 5'-diphospho)-2-C-methyl-D-erythritol kinase [Candidatus Euphemobacter frigidus]MDP8275918.1 4-(cytidine 5'-diphospho)-2-C-methyl-D-erythritol kinase [Candidatus Euphemobacter frigidus]
MENRWITYTSPCKFNLFLDVLGRRPDGFHEVVTVIEPLALYDTLEILETPDDISVTIDHSGVPDGPDNIIYQAVRLIREETGIEKGVEIRVKKVVPVAGGLGGGSANAALTLRMLNKLWGLNLSRSTLFRLAERLGSDVPFFLNPTTSLCRGRGEESTPLPLAPPFWVVLINPAFPISTHWAYRQLSRPSSPRTPHSSLEKILDALKRSDLTALSSSLYNVFQEVLEPRLSPIHEILEFFRRSGTIGTVLSGSGPTVVGLVEREAEARDLAVQARAVFPAHYLIHTAGNSLSRKFYFIDLPEILY